MKKIIVPIKGMHCRSCEILIKDKLGEIEGVERTQADFKKQQAEIWTKKHIPQEEIKAAIERAGYEVGADQKAWISKNIDEYLDLGIALVVLFILYIIAKKFGLFDLNLASSTNPSSLVAVLLIGLTAGVSTCMALVGGLVLGISAKHSEKHPESTSFQKFRPHIFFNMGRIISFAILGGVIGLLGQAFQFSGLTLGLLIIIVGIVMFVLGVQLTEIFPRVSSGGLTLPTSLSNMLGIKKHHNKEYSHFNSSLIGALTFFLPCGFTQAMQLYAMSTGNFWQGAAIMGIFAIGTAPGLIGIGGLTSLIKGAFAKKFFKFVGVLVIFLAIFNISNGLKLTGWKGVASSKTPITETQNITLENGVQVARMVQGSRGYTPNKFVIKKNVPVKWIIDSQDSYSCAASIFADKIGVKKFLSAGENIIEFTPQELGEIRFSCSMGMYSGNFTVIENDQPITTPTKNTKTLPKVKSKNTNSQTASTIQVIRTTYLSPQQDIQPKEFTVKLGQPVRFEVSANVDGYGCMSAIMIPGLSDTPQVIEKGKTLVFEFTPRIKGEYPITCAMRMVRGVIKVI